MDVLGRVSGALSDMVSQHIGNSKHLLEVLDKTASTTLGTIANTLASKGPTGATDASSTPTSRSR